MIRVATAAAIAALLACVHWTLVQPAPIPIGAVEATLFAFPITKLSDDHNAYTAGFRLLSAAILVATAALAAALSLLIQFRAEANQANRDLAVSLALGAWGGVALGLLPFYTGYLAVLGWNAGPAWQFAWQASAYAAFYCATAYLARFFLAYPRTPTEAQWERHFAAILEETIARTRTGWRRHFYARKSREDAVVAEGTAGEAVSPKKPGYFVVGRNGGRQFLRQIAFFRSRHALTMFVVLAVAGAALDIAAFRQPAGAATAHSTFPVGIARAALTFVAFMAMEFAILTAFQGLQFHRRNAAMEERARIDWIYGTLLVGGLILAAIPPLWWGLMIFVLPGLEAGTASVPGPILFTGPLVLGLQLLFLALIASIALSIFYRGTVDPRLAARKLTTLGLLGILVAFVFIFVERLVALKLVAWFGLPKETGLVVAGAAVTASFQPIRARTEAWVGRFVARYLPLDSLVDGERKTLAIVMSDLSGYTSLSARNEKQALLLATLLQRTAERLCLEHDGRVVKTMGDAVMLAFASPVGAATALARLHAEFAPAARTLGLESLPVHSGAHLGEVTETRDKDLYGQAVNIAARLQGRAAPGECVLSREFADAAALSERDYRALGPLALKNVPVPVPSVALAVAA